MAEKYYVNKRAQSNGDHEVHHSGCYVLPKEENRTYLGEFENCRDAVEAAKKIHSEADGCSRCCSECHTG